MRQDGQHREILSEVRVCASVGQAIRMTFRSADTRLLAGLGGLMGVMRRSTKVTNVFGCALAACLACAGLHGSAGQPAEESSGLEADQASEVVVYDERPC